MPDFFINNLALFPWKYVKMLSYYWNWNNRIFPRLAQICPKFEWDLSWHIFHPCSKFGGKLLSAILLSIKETNRPTNKDTHRGQNMILLVTSSHILNHLWSFFILCASFFIWVWSVGLSACAAFVPWLPTLYNPFTMWPCLLDMERRDKDCVKYSS